MDFFSESRELLDSSASNKYPMEWKNYIRARKEVYSRLLPNYVKPNMRSEAMWVLRSHCPDGEAVGIYPQIGDICWMDYGQSFINEMGYQHFGLVVAMCHKKALVVPLTSNETAYAKADGSHSKHLLRIGQPKGLNKPSTLFLNDLRFINTARILEIKAHIDPSSDLFQNIRSRIIGILMGGV